MKPPFYMYHKFTTKARFTLSTHTEFHPYIQSPISTHKLRNNSNVPHQTEIRFVSQDRVFPYCFANAPLVGNNRSKPAKALSCQIARHFSSRGWKSFCFFLLHVRSKRNNYNITQRSECCSDDWSNIELFCEGDGGILHLIIVWELRANWEYKMIFTFVITPTDLRQGLTIYIYSKIF